MKSKRESTSGVNLQFWDDIKSRVHRIQDLTESHSIDEPQDLLRSTKLPIESKMTSSSIQRHNVDIPSPIPFDFSSYTVQNTEESEFSIISDAPNQMSFSNIHSNFANAYEDEIIRVKDESKGLQDALNNRLSAFRNASETYVSSNVRIQAELDLYREEMKSMKKSIHDLLDETEQSKREMEKARELLVMSHYGKHKYKTPIESPELNYSVSRYSNKENIEEKILELHQEINIVSDKLLKGEEIRAKIEKENHEIKEIVCKLEEAIYIQKQDSRSEILIEKVTYRQEKIRNGCSDKCYIF